MSKAPAKAPAAAPAAAAGAPEGEAPKKKGKGKLLLIAIPVVLILVVAGLWFSGILPGLLGMGHKHEAGKPGEAPAEEAKAAPKVLVFTDLPEIVANLNTAAKKATFVKLHVKLELGKEGDQAAVTAALPRLLDLFQTYLRETRPEELRGAAGTWRLRQELVARANIALTPVRVNDVLFTEMLVQ